MMKRGGKDRAKEFALCYVDGDVPAQQAVHRLCGIPIEQEFRKSILLTQVFEVIKYWPPSEHELLPPTILSAVIGPALDPTSFLSSFQMFLQKLKDRPLYGMVFVFSSFRLSPEQMSTFLVHVDNATREKYPGLNAMPWCTDQADCEKFRRQFLLHSNIKEHQARRTSLALDTRTSGGQEQLQTTAQQPCGAGPSWIIAEPPPVIIIRSGAHERHFKVSDSFRTSDALIRHLKLYVEGVEEVPPKQQQT